MMLPLIKTDNFVDNMHSKLRRRFEPILAAPEWPRSSLGRLDAISVYFSWADNWYNSNKWAAKPPNLLGSERKLNLSLGLYVPPNKVITEPCSCLRGLSGSKMGSIWKSLNRHGVFISTRCPNGKLNHLSRWLICALIVGVKFNF